MTTKTYAEDLAEAAATMLQDPLGIVRALEEKIRARALLDFTGQIDGWRKAANEAVVARNTWKARALDAEKVAADFARDHEGALEAARTDAKLAREEAEELRAELADAHARINNLTSHVAEERQRATLCSHCGAEVGIDVTRVMTPDGEVAHMACEAAYLAAEAAR